MAGKGTKNNQQNTQGDAQTEQASADDSRLILMYASTPSNQMSPSKGTASVNINGAFAIRGVKIIEGSQWIICIHAQLQGRE